MRHIDPERRLLAIALAALAGFVDASGFVGHGGYFLSFMSGNTTRLAVDLAGAGPSALVPAGIIASFVGGVALGTAWADRAQGRKRKALLLVAVGLALWAAAWADGHGLPGPAIAAMASAMGALNTTFQRDGEVAIGLTYMTGALVKIGQGLGGWLGGHRRAGWNGWAALWSALASGGLAGAVLALRAPWCTGWLAGGWALLAAAQAHRISRKT